jgi:AraC-like DNA-binding protein/ligand-binding sensor protein
MNSPTYEALTRSRLLRDFKRGFRDATRLSLKLVPKDAGARYLTDASNSFCALMATHAAGCGVCVEVRKKLERRFERKLTPQTVCCFAGMVDVAVPVTIGGKHVATLFGGQVFCHKPGRRQFERLGRQLREWGMRTEFRLAKRAYFQTPLVSPKEFHGAVRLLTVFADHLAESANGLLLARHREDPEAVTRAKSFAREHAAERVALRDVAAHVHLSKYYFCKAFKKSTAMTFTEYLSRLRVEHAKKELGDPWLTVTTVSHRAGFNSISQFNRAFLRYEGRSPTAYRAAALRRATG